MPHVNSTDHRLIVKFDAHWLTQAVRLQLFALMAAEEGYQLKPEELYWAVGSWLKLQEPAAALAAWQAHKQLAVQWTAAQQQHAFAAALDLIKTKFQLAAFQLAMNMSSIQTPHRSQQVQDLVQALLQAQRVTEAYTVSLDYTLSCTPNCTLSLATCNLVTVASSALENLKVCML